MAGEVRVTWGDTFMRICVVTSAQGYTGIGGNTTHSVSALHQLVRSDQ